MMLFLPLKGNGKDWLKGAFGWFAIALSFWLVLEGLGLALAYIAPTLRFAVILGLISGLSIWPLLFIVGIIVPIYLLVGLIKLFLDSTIEAKPKIMWAIPSILILTVLGVGAYWYWQETIKIAEHLSQAQERYENPSTPDERNNVRRVHHSSYSLSIKAYYEKYASFPGTNDQWIDIEEDSRYSRPPCKEMLDLFPNHKCSTDPLKQYPYQYRSNGSSYFEFSFVVEEKKCQQKFGPFSKDQFKFGPIIDSIELEAGICRDIYRVDYNPSEGLLTGHEVLIEAAGSPVSSEEAERIRQEITVATQPGIQLSKIDIPDTRRSDGILYVAISGQAATRADILQLEDNLSQLTGFVNLVSPVSNLLPSEDIMFQMTVEFRAEN